MGESYEMQWQIQWQKSNWILICWSLARKVECRWNDFSVCFEIIFYRVRIFFYGVWNFSDIRYPQPSFLFVRLCKPMMNCYSWFTCHISLLPSDNIFLSVFGYSSTANNHGTTYDMDDIAEFSASNRSRNHLPRFADCSWNLIYCLVKICTLSRLFSM